MNHKPVIFGHRGARGLFPENTVDGFINTVKLGVSALELDVVISKDSQVVVSHEPWFNYKICSMPSGEKVKRLKQRNIYKMNYAEIKKFDCGKRIHPDFPLQKSFPAHKPLLSQVIAAVEKYNRENILPPATWLIEIKSHRMGDNRFHPAPKKFAGMVYDAVEPFRIDKRIIFQSFDQRVLKEFHKIDKAVKTALLFIRASSLERKIKQLGFVPYAFGPSYRFLEKKIIAEAHQHGAKILTWTVNDEKNIKKLLSLGVDGIITDYPDKALKIIDQ